MGPKPTYYTAADRWLDIVGFRKKDRFAWQRLDEYRRCFLFGELARGTCYGERVRGGGTALLRKIGGMQQGSGVENGCGIQMI
jgi:hypothetical protein